MTEGTEEKKEPGATSASGTGAEAGALTVDGSTHKKVSILSE